MLLAARRREGRSGLRRPPDAVALGPYAAATSRRRAAPPARSACTRSACAEAGRLYERVARHSRSRATIPRRRSHLRLDRRRRDQRRRVLGIAEHRVHRAACRCSTWSRTTATRSPCPVEVQTPGGDISRLVASFPGLQVFRCDGTDFLASYRTHARSRGALRARARGRRWCTPKVIRPYSHSLSDDEKLYKTPEEREAEARRDPLVRMRALPARRAARHRGGARRRFSPTSIAKSTPRPNEALAAPKPAAETRGTVTSSRPTSTRHRRRFDTTRTARRQARHDGRRDQRDAEGRDGAQPAHRRLRRGRRGREPRDGARRGAGQGRRLQGDARPAGLYGSDRVFNSPLAEANIIGRAVGMAMRGLKPVVEIQFFDYIWPAIMQLRDEMAMMRYRSSNNWSCPMVMRVPIGGYLRGGAPYHSQSGVSIFAHCPGIRIAFPSNARGCGGAAAHRDPLRRPGACSWSTSTSIARPTTRAPIPGPSYMIPFGKASVRARRHRRRGVHLGRAGAALARSRRSRPRRTASASRSSICGRSCRYDWDTIAALHEEDQPRHRRARGSAHCGFGAEIAARIADELFERARRAGPAGAALDCPVAYAPELEEAILPQAADVLKAIIETAAY